MSPKIWISSLLLSILLSGCESPKITTEQIEEMGIITARGTDLTDDKSIETTLVIFQFDVQSDSITKIFSGKGKTIKGAEENASLGSPFKLTSGKVQIELYGKEAAENGLIPYLDPLHRDAAVNNTMYLAIGDPAAKDILSLNTDIVTMNMGQFLYEVINSSASDYMLPKITLQDFLRNFYDVGIDNVLPVFEIAENGSPRISRAALFKADQYIGDLSIQDNLFINLINSTIKDQLLEFTVPLAPFKEHLAKAEYKKLPDNFHGSIRINKGNTKTKLIDKEKLTFQSNITIEARLQEQSSHIVFDNLEIIKKLETEIEKEMGEHLESILKTTQEYAADPFGYGKLYRTKQKDGNLTNKEWREKYPEIKVDFNVDLEIIRHGATE